MLGGKKLPHVCIGLAPAVLIWRHEGLHRNFELGHQVLDFARQIFIRKKSRQKVFSNHQNKQKKKKKKQKTKKTEKTENSKNKKKKKKKRRKN